MSGRGLVLGHVVLNGLDATELFTGQGYAPAPLTQQEEAVLTDKPSEDAFVRLDFAQDLELELKQSLANDFESVLSAMRSRAPVDLRVNFIKSTRQDAQEALQVEGIQTELLESCTTGLRVGDGARKVKNSRCYQEGLVELQDVSSQRAAEFAAPKAGETVLDYCSGGGGKTLALGSLSKGEISLHAFDVNPKRMSNLPERAERADLSLEICSEDRLSRLRGQCDLVMVDAPCSGSGSWRRLPQQKWLLSEEKLHEYNIMQDDALEKAHNFVAPNGRLIYATCSLFRSENQDRLANFLINHPDWKVEEETQLTPITGGDGFFFARVVRQ